MSRYWRHRDGRYSRHRSRSRRRRRLRLVRIVLAAAVVATFLGLVTYLLFTQPVRSSAGDQYRQHAVVDASFEERVRGDTRHSTRPHYRYSVIPGGAYSRKELSHVLGQDPVVATHYSSLDIRRVRTARMRPGRRAYVSYRLNDRIYWTKRPVLLQEGETVLTDGATMIRARCGNCISDSPMEPTSENEPPARELDALEDLLIGPPEPDDLERSDPRASPAALSPVAPLGAPSSLWSPSDQRVSLGDSALGTAHALGPEALPLLADALSFTTGSIPDGSVTPWTDSTPIDSTSSSSDSPSGPIPSIPAPAPSPGAPSSSTEPGLGYDPPSRNDDSPQSHSDDPHPTITTTIPTRTILDPYEGDHHPSDRIPPDDDARSIPEPGVLLLMGSGAVAVLTRAAHRRLRTAGLERRDPPQRGI